MKYYRWTGSRWEGCEGEPAALPGVDLKLWVYQYPNGGDWAVVELETGCEVAVGDSQQGAIEAAAGKILFYGVWRTREIIADFIAARGRPPLSGPASG